MFNPLSKYMRHLGCILGVIFLFLFPLGCSDDPTDPPADDDPIIENSDIHVDEGFIGTVIDTRAIFRRGYTPTTARVEFADHSTYNTELDIDQVTNMAFLSLHNESLTEEEKTAFGNGVVATLTILDSESSNLAEVSFAQMVLDDRNVPISFTTDFQHISKPVVLRTDLPYLIQWEQSDYLIEQISHNSISYDSQFIPDTITQQFFFTPVLGEEYVYTVKVLREYFEWEEWIVFPEDASGRIYTNTDLLPNPLQVTFQQDEDGYVKIVDHLTGKFVGIDQVPGANYYLYLDDENFERFRLISDHINWSIIDRGTVFNQPIMPPARLDFAYSGTLRNCAPTILEEAIGRTESRTRTTSFETTESFQMFSSETYTMGITIGFEVAANIGVDVEGIGEAGEEVTISEELSMTEEFTYSETTSQELKWSDTVQSTSEVSRVRTITLPEYTAVDIYDAVKTITNVRVPFTQKIRITGDDKDTGNPLTGEEIQSQMLFNFVQGIITGVGDNYIDFTLRGASYIDNMFEATTNVEEIVGACD